ncbi:MAG: hypothetical protein ABI668_10195 [Sphingorhabdus sp.]
MHIANHDLRQKTIFPCHAIRFEDLGRVDQHLRNPFHFTGHGAHSDAGDGARVLGARSAEVTGELAALAALVDLGHTIDVGRRRKLIAQKARYRRFADGLAHAFPWPHELAAETPDDAIMRRCEAVTADALRTSAENGATEVNRAKAYSRVDIGRCQGRNCGNTSAEIVAAAHGQSLESIGRLRGQAPGLNT